MGNDLPAIVGGSVIHQNQLPVRISLGKQSIEIVFKVVPMVVIGKNYRYQQGCGGYIVISQWCLSCSFAWIGMGIFQNFIDQIIKGCHHCALFRVRGDNLRGKSIFASCQLCIVPMSR